MELETFLPKNGSEKKNGVIVSKQKEQEASQDAERCQLKREDGSFDPFRERVVENPTTDFDTLTHLLKSALGTGILSMPLAFKNSGLLFGVLGTLIVGLICTHCTYVLVKCAHVLYHRTRKTKMDFAEVAEAALATGPKWGRKYTTTFKYFIKICLFVTYFGAVSSYTVIISHNFRDVFHQYSDWLLHDGNTIVRVFISSLLVPLILLCWVPNLKKLASLSMIANGLMGISLAITFYYLVNTIVSMQEIHPSVWKFSVPKLSDLPNFFSITVFAIEAIGVIMPLENDMKTPQNFVGTFGVLNRGMFGVTLLYIIVGVLGYCAFGICTEDVVTLNLPGADYAAQTVKISIGLAVFLTFGLQFFVCLNIAQSLIQDRFKSNPVLANYVLRTVLVTLSVLLAVAIPEIGPFIGLIGAFCFSILGLLIPVFIETITYWDTGFGKWNWMAIKNVIISILAIVVLVAGSKNAVGTIMNLYSGEKEKLPEECNLVVGNTTLASVYNTTVASLNNTTVASFYNTTVASVYNTTIASVNSTLASVITTTIKSISNSSETP